MGGLASCATSIIVLINTFFGLIGLIFLSLGVLVKQFPETVDSLMSMVLGKLDDVIPDEAGIDVDELSVTEFIGGAATPLIVLGVILLAIVVWAYCGTCCKSKWMLIVYIILLSAIIIGEVVFVVLFVTKRDMMDGELKKPLKTSLTKYYGGEKASDGASLGWNAIMGLLDCCGVDGYEDFSHTTAWNHSYTQDITTAGLTTTRTITVDAPILCCVTPDLSCATTGQTTNKYKEKGCYSALWDLVDNNKSIVIGALAGLGAFQVILWLFVLVVIRSLCKDGNKVRPV